MRIKLQILACCVFLSLQGFAQNYPPGFSQVLVANNITRPTAMAIAPDSRIFITCQDGALLLIKPGILKPDTILQLVVNSLGERGLIGVAIDPEFKSNNYLYLYYTAITPILHNRISRFTLEGNGIVPGSEQIVLDLDRSTSAVNHNGGGLEFGIDGKLYVAIGENGERAYGQDLTTYHGKILRINKDGSVPPDNPFASSAREQTKRIWAYGVRNPFTLAIQAGTGRLFVNDVGQSAWEEINDATAGGKNFGWAVTEGPTTNPAYTSPIYAYNHGSADGRGCAITGGDFFNPDSTNYPSQFYGKYFFQDLCSRWINVLDFSVTPPVRTPFATAIPNNALYITTGVDGNLYFLSRTTGSLYKIVYNNLSPPFIVNQPGSLSVLQREPASFSVAAIGSTPFEYQWQKDNSDIAGATSGTYSLTSAKLSDAGKYRVIISNAAGKDTSDVATLDVTHVNLKPTAAITQPDASSKYVAGTQMVFAGTGTDDDDGDLGPQSFKWNVDFYHNANKENVFADEGIKGGSFLIPDEGNTAIDVWYRLILTVTDSEGAQDVDSIDVSPATATISFETNPPGLQVKFHEDFVTPPFAIESVQGMLHDIDAPSPQILNDVFYQFVSWSNGGAASQTFTTPQADVTLFAEFSVVVGTEEDLPGQQVHVLSNPATNDQVNLMIRSTRDQTASIQMMNVLANEAVSSTPALSGGDNSVTIDTRGLRPGLYLVTVVIDGNRTVRKVVVLK